ncbi:MAG: DUF2062 domain-containing protein [Nitrospira sp.]|nr:DUF2062 domain-containing protein [Nitrospira sp.]MDH4249578.1 DUF2062 domain-containing protein [Nitrospira sp.]MDH4341664.1 DUF2062 domain-containing protein [Nitrospira sp.]MDH5335618.1 DUF2062 domain-containing protein [Nitrospira sp.]
MGNRSHQPSAQRTRSFRALLRQVLHLQESPQRTALAFALGVFIAFSPAYGLHTAMVVLCTWLFGLNFLALLTGALVNNPWTVIPILGATYWTGALLLGRTDQPSFDWQDMSFSGIYQQVLPYAAPFVLGGLVLSVLGALVSYPAACLFFKKHRCAPTSPTIEPLPPPDQVG